MFEITLPYPPTVNHYYRHVGNKVLISAEGRAYRKAVYFIVSSRPRMVTIEGGVEMEVDVYIPDNRRRDIDNILKALLDALEYAKLYKNDSQIQKLKVEKVDFEKGGKVVVRVNEVKLLKNQKSRQEKKNRKRRL